MGDCHPFTMPDSPERTMLSLWETLSNIPQSRMWNEDYHQFIMHCPLLLPPHPAPVWRPTHRRQSSTNVSSMDPFHGLQFFTNSSSMCPFYGVTPSGKGSVSSPQGHRFCQEPAPCVSSESESLSGTPTFYSAGLLQRLQVDLCSCGLSWAAAGLLFPHSLPHRLLGHHLCSVAWSQQGPCRTVPERAVSGDPVLPWCHLVPSRSWHCCPPASHLH